MIFHGDALRRNFRLRIRKLEAGLLSGETAVEAIPEALRRTAELRRDQLHVPAAALGLDADELGRADAARLCVRGEGQPAHHAHRAPEKRGGADGAVS